MSDESPEDWGDRVVLVTGATSGIGRATANLLASRGARLVLAARSADTLEATRQECVARGAGDVLVVRTDVGRRADVDTLFQESVDRFDKLDAVVHGAAVLSYGRFEDVPADVFDGVVTTNVIGFANVARAALQQFDVQGHGSLVVLGSVVGKISAPFMSTYTTTKWAMHGLVRTLQIESRSRPHVSVSLISPGGVDTPIYDLAGTYAGRGGNPPPPVARPEKVAAAAIEAIDRPVRERDVGLANRIMVLGFRWLPGLFDVLVTPLMRGLGLGRTTVPEGPGNVLEPRPEIEAVHGRWPRLWG